MSTHCSETNNWCDSCHSCHGNSKIHHLSVDLELFFPVFQLHNELLPDDYMTITTRWPIRLHNFPTGYNYTPGLNEYFEKWNRIIFFVNDCFCVAYICTPKHVKTINANHHLFGFGLLYVIHVCFMFVGMGECLGDVKSKKVVLINSHCL